MSSMDESRVVEERASLRMQINEVRGQWCYCGLNVPEAGEAEMRGVYMRTEFLRKMEAQRVA